MDENGYRNLYLGGDAIQSSMLLAEPDRLVLEYSRAMLCALLFRPEPARVLLIGLGGGSLVKFLLNILPQGRIDVVEIDPELIEIAHRYFHLPRNDRLRFISAPGQKVVATRAAAGARYDLLLVDAFDENGPARALLETSFLENCRTLLAPGGVFVMNLWNRPVDHFPDHLQRLRALFGPGTRRLVLGRANTSALVFGMEESLSPDRLMGLKPAAARLSRRTGIDFVRFLRQLHAQNIPGLPSDLEISRHNRL